MKQVIFILSFLMIFEVASAEGVISFGGEKVIAEFHQTLNIVIQQQNRVSPALRIYPNLPNNLKKLDATLKITATEKRLKWQGSDVVMINYPQKNLLEISIPRWSELAGDDNLKQALVLHEALALLGISDVNYENSTKLIKIFNAAGNESVFEYLTSQDQAPEKFAKESEGYYRTAPLDAFFIEQLLLQDIDWVQAHKTALAKISADYFANLNSWYCTENFHRNAIRNLALRSDAGSRAVTNEAQKWIRNTCLN